MIKPQIEPINVAEKQRKIYALTEAKYILERMNAAPENAELILAHGLYEALGDYERGLEHLCNAYAKMASDTLGTSLPPPFVVKGRPSQ